MTRGSTSPWGAVAKISLWSHQAAAVDDCRRYFESGSTRSALVQMPTGTGKTGVMAVTAAIQAQTRPCLVVCPSRALVNQLTADIGGDFWRTIGAPLDWAPEHTPHLLPTTVRDTVRRAASGRTVAFATVQGLQQIHAGAEYAALAGVFGTVLFDEGHREPAPLWAQAVRGLGASTVLLSATPFRNDLKLFDVDMDHVHFLSFAQAVKDKLIRGVELNERDLPLDARGFAREAIAVRDGLIRSGRFGPENKMIVRAASEHEVESLYTAFVEELRGRPDGVLALHDNFPLEGDVGAQRRPDVPTDLRKRKEAFLIHQYMLVEGIDDPACTMLALYSSFPTERQLVQQIGRITRHGGRIGTPVSEAYVLARAGDDVDKMWRRFLSYDAQCVRAGGKPPLRNDRKIFEDLVGALPDMDYVGGKFRARMDLDVPEIDQEIRIPKSAVVFQLDAGFAFGDFQRDVARALDQDDRYVVRSGDFGIEGSGYHISLRLAQSPHLADALFLAPSLELTAYARHGDKLFFYDSGGLWLEDNSAMERAGPARLRSLLPKAKDTTVTSLVMKNTDLGPVAVRSRSMSARSLAVSGTFIGEHLHVVTRASGRVGSSRRVLGFARSRVREAEGVRWTLREFFEWTEGIAAELASGRTAADIFLRFAIPVAPPQDTTPINILVDIEDLAEEFVDEGGHVVAFDPDQVCVDIVEDSNGPAGFRHRFDVTADKSPKRVWIRWDAKKRKYWLRSDDLSGYKLKENEKVSLTRRLNQRQPFRVVVAGSKIVYAYGGFYEVDLDLKRSGGIGSLILNLIEGVDGLASVTSEKGDLHSAAATWPDGSLFRFVDKALAPRARSQPFGEPFSALVCDDLGAEVADFIGVDEGAPAVASRLALIHAKWKDGVPGVSASLVYDVCGQAVSKLAYIKPDATAVPGSKAKWDGPWKHDGARIARIRQGGDAAALRSSISIVRGDPKSQRAVWLVLGGGILSKAALADELKRAEPKAHVLQFAHLILSTYAACQSIGADLRIFCAS